jgi:hypothetical protein
MRTRDRHQRHRTNPHRASRTGSQQGLDYFLTTTCTYPTLAEWYEVMALDASNKLNA